MTLKSMFWKQCCALNIRYSIFSVWFWSNPKVFTQFGHKIDKDLTEEEVQTSLLVNNIWVLRFSSTCSSCIPPKRGPTKKAFFRQWLFSSHRSHLRIANRWWKAAARVWGWLQLVCTGWSEPTETHFGLLLSSKVAAGWTSSGARSIYSRCPFRALLSTCGQRGQATGQYAYAVVQLEMWRLERRRKQKLTDKN